MAAQVPCPFLGGRFREEFLDVFREEVGFEVHCLADFHLLEVSCVVGMRGDPKDGGGGGEFGDGEGNSVEAKGSLIEAKVVDFFG